MHKTLLESLGEKDKNIKEYIRSNADLADRLSTMEIERRTERTNLNEKININKTEAETIEQISKDKLKEQIKLTQSMKNEYESERKDNLKTIQENEEKIMC